MSALAWAESATAAVHRHADLREYAVFVRQRPDTRVGQTALKAARRFVRAYPDLRDWFGAPLAERVAVPRHPGDRGTPANARPYLYFLARRGLARFDYDWILGVQTHVLTDDVLDPRAAQLLQSLIDEATALGYGHATPTKALRRVVRSLYLHLPMARLLALGDDDLGELADAVRAFADRPDAAMDDRSARHRRGVVADYRCGLHALRAVLYHRGQIAAAPRRRCATPARAPSPRPLMEAAILRYLRARRATDTRPATLERLGWSLRCFVAWIAAEDAAVASFADVTREHALAYAELLQTVASSQTGRPLSLESRLSRLSALSVFFRDAAAWSWPDAPGRPLIGPGDLPKRPMRVPRYVPAEELARLMDAVRRLPCPYQRAALLVARWSGARRGEVRALERDCLDAYPDGTARLRIPVGKTKSERVVPLHPEAAAAVRALQAVPPVGRGFRDEQTGVVAHRLFVGRGRLYSASYLFEAPLAEACRLAGLLGPDGRPTVTAHRLRHTVATELAERGAKLHTIMKLLGHTSVGMAMVYAYISDNEVLRDYQRVLGPGAAVAGPAAAALRAGALPTASVDWLKANFLETELELGHCLRLPQEGPCECDLFLSCAKFVTTPAYAPRLRARRLRELELVADAIDKGWAREVERHRCTVARIEHLLAELGQPLEEASVR